MSAWIPSFIIHQNQLLATHRNVRDSIHGSQKSRAQKWLVEHLKFDFHVFQLNFLLFAAFAEFLLEAHSFAPSTVHLAALCNLRKKKKNSPFSDLSSLSCARCCWQLATMLPDCESAIVMPVMSGPRLCESASSCSAICPRPGSLIREESCGKVCVFLPDVPLSLQLFVRVGPRQQHRGPETVTQQLGCAAYVSIVEMGKVESWKQSKKHQTDAGTRPPRITRPSIWNDCCDVCVEMPNLLL